MKTRTRQCGVVGLMSRLIRNIKAAALALAALGAAQTAQAATSQSFVWVGSAAPTSSAECQSTSSDNKGISMTDRRDEDIEGNHA